MRRVYCPGCRPCLGHQLQELRNLGLFSPGAWFCAVDRCDDFPQLALLEALAQRQCHVLPRRRWRGCERSQDAVQPLCLLAVLCRARRVCARVLLCQAFRLLARLQLLLFRLLARCAQLQLQLLAPHWVAAAVKVTEPLRVGPCVGKNATNLRRPKSSEQSKTKAKGEGQSTQRNMSTARSERSRRREVCVAARLAPHASGDRPRAHRG